MYVVSWKKIPVSVSDILLLKPSIKKQLVQQSLI